jgi:hypothetical protein
MQITLNGKPFVLANPINGVTITSLPLVPVGPQHLAPSQEDRIQKLEARVAELEDLLKALHGGDLLG